jgi:hypothetical protein
MPVTHGVAGSSPVQTAKIGKRFSETKTFFAQNKYLRLVVLFRYDFVTRSLV